MRRACATWGAICLTLLLTTGFVQAQPSGGSIAGRIESSWNGAPVMKAVVAVRGTTLAATTDGSGNYRIENVPTGAATITVTKSGFERKTVENIRVAPGQTSSANVRMNPVFQELPEFELISEPVVDQRQELFTQRQEALDIKDIMGSEEFGRLGVNDAAGAVGKMTGVTVEDGKFPVIRGLNDRYTSTTLNNGAVPSADPKRQSPQLDLFPSGMIETIEVAKTYTPDQPATFTGGAVNIVTKSFPDSFLFNFSGGVSYNTEASLKDNFLVSDDSGTDFLGFDGGKRAMPEILEESDFNDSSITFSSGALTTPSRFAQLERAEAAVNSFGSRQLGPKFGSSLLNHNLSFSLGDTEKVLDRKLGWFTSYSYRRDFSFQRGRVEQRPRFDSSFPGGIRLSEDRLVDAAVDSANWGGVASVAYELSEDHKLSFNFLRTQSAEDRAVNRFFFEDDNFSDEDTGLKRVLHFTQRSLQTYQVKGEHTFPDLAYLEAEWLVSLARTTQDEPDFRQSAIQIATNPTTGATTPSFSADFAPSTPERLWREISEANKNYRLDFRLPFIPWNGEEGKLKFGLFRSASDRDLFERRFNINVTGATLESADGDINEALSVGNTTPTLTTNSFAGGRFVIVRGDLPSSVSQGAPNVQTFEGRLLAQAGYLMADFPVHEKVNLVGGYRLEAATFDTDAFTAVAGAPPPGEASIEEVGLFPAAGLIWEPASNHVVRLHYAETYARGSFREYNPFRQPDSITGDDFIGNPDLKFSYAKNYDIRWEWYPRPGELLAVGAFYKKIENPIEQVLLGDTGGLRTVGNSPGATVQGLELEARKKLDFIEPKLEHWSLGFNAALIKSEAREFAQILSRKRALFPDTLDTRPLFDQPPYVLNWDINYDNPDNGFSGTLSANVKGKTLAAPSNLTPNVFREPLFTLNLTLSKEISDKWTIKFSARNLLDPTVTESYDLDDSFDRLVYSAYRRGRSFGVSASYKF